MTRRVLRWLLPGLLGDPSFTETGSPSGATPSLDLALARGHEQPGGGRDYPTAVAAALCQAPPPDRDVPSAAYCRLGAGLPVRPGEWWFHADPVMLRAGRDRVLVFDLRPADLSGPEAEALLRELTRYFAPLGWRFEAAGARRWYVSPPAPLVVTTRPLVETVGRSLAAHLPEGPDAARCRAWLNEAQMVLHHADVNRDRELRGEHPVNGLWLWGCGSLPAPSPCPDVEVVAADELTRGVALHAGCGCVAAEHALDRPGTVVYPDAALQRSALDADREAWWAALAPIEERCGLLLQALRRGRLDALVIDSCEGVAWRVDRAALRRFWRRPRGAFRRLLARRALA